MLNFKKKNKFFFLEYDKVFIPINVTNSHWFLIVIHMQSFIIEWYESLPGIEDRNTYLQCVQDYMSAEYPTWGPGIFKEANPSPKQENGFDCGIFVMATATFLVNDLVPFYSQKDVLDREWRFNIACKLLSYKYKGNFVFIFYLFFIYFLLLYFYYY